MDESTDVSDISQLLLCIRTADENLIVCEELFKTCLPYGFAKGIDIFNSLVSVIEFYGEFEMCECVVTDGARAMTGQGIGLAGILKNHGVNCPMFYCIIHQEALCVESLQMSDVMITVTNIVNIIREGNKDQRHRIFIQF